MSDVEGLFFSESVADLGGAVEGAVQTQLGAPFLARRVPLILTQMHSFFMFCSECRNILLIRHSENVS